MEFQTSPEAHLGFSGKNTLFPFWNAVPPKRPKEDFFMNTPATQLGLPWWLRWQRICVQCRRRGFHPWVGKIPWRRQGNPLQVCLSADPHASNPGG